MATDTGLRKNDYPRVCDICGHRFWFSELSPIGELKFACKDDAPGLTALQISRFNARVKPIVVRPNKYAKDYVQTPIYQLAEAEIFNFIAATAPLETKDGVATVLGAAWSAIYMADIVTQDKRPAIWEATARATVARCCTYLLTRQYGSPSGFSPTGAASDTRYGGLTDNTPTGAPTSTATWSTAKTIAAGVAFVKAYNATGNLGYLAAAEKCATFIRHVQSGNLQVSNYTVYPSGGGRYRLGGLASGVADSNGVLLDSYYLADVSAAWFLALLGAVKGMGTVYGDTAATSYFSAPSSGTITQMIAELTTFATVGVPDSTHNGALTTGLSSTAPSSVYVAATTAGGAASWEAAATIASDDLSLALLGLYTANGLTAKVSEMIDWLGSFASNVNNRTLPTTPESRVLADITGTYDPTLCPADLLRTAAPFTEADDALYSWSSFGLLSPIYATTAIAAFKRSKDQLSVSQRYSALDNHEKFLGPLGSSGLSLQPVYRDSLGGLVFPGGPGGGVSSSETTITMPPGIWLRLEGDKGITPDGLGFVSAWVDQSGHNRGPTTYFISGPLFDPNSIDGQPGLFFDGNKGLTNAVDNLPHGARTIFAVAKPFNQTGGTTITFRRGLTDWAAYSWLFGGTQYVWSDGATNIAATTPVNYSGAGHLFEHSQDGANNLTVRIDGAVIATGVATTTNEAGIDGFTVGGRELAFYQGWYGWICQLLVFARDLPESERIQVRAILSQTYSSLPFASPTPVRGQSVVKAAKTGMLYRQAPGRYPALRGN